MQVNLSELDSDKRHAQEKAALLGKLISEAPQDLKQIMELYCFAKTHNQRTSLITRRVDLRNYILGDRRYKSTIEAFLALVE